MVLENQNIDRIVNSIDTFTWLENSCELPNLEKYSLCYIWNKVKSINLLLIEQVKIYKYRLWDGFLATSLTISGQKVCSRQAMLWCFVSPANIDITVSASWAIILKVLISRAVYQVWGWEGIIHQKCLVIYVIERLHCVKPYKTMF